MQQRVAYAIRRGQGEFGEVFAVLTAVVFWEFVAAAALIRFLDCNLAFAVRRFEFSQARRARDPPAPVGTQRRKKVMLAWLAKANDLVASDGTALVEPAIEDLQVDGLSSAEEGTEFDSDSQTEVDLFGLALRGVCLTRRDALMREMRDAIHVVVSVFIIDKSSLALCLL